ncbi:MAG: phosphate ABC transporter permease PstA [Anaerolineaceae bacterium]|jgi:phosphate transport system permease protein|nr:phosphate ABC transporter permease PstA [Anaerolineaceae bacterium]MDI9531317.1 phosphate ABC transporter permease PstA [Chloroflexota bacterium]HNZ15741.1 phosphate ABC transporter permease PstA [Anaerolineaceae bacterium]
MIGERSSEITLAHTAKTRNLKTEHRVQKFWFSLMWLFGLITVLILILVIGYVLVQGGKAVNWELLTTPPKGGLSGEGGISTTIATTFYLVGLTLLIATPLGVSAAVYLIEYAGEQSLSSKFLRTMINIANFAVETLAGIPSIIFGLFGYVLFVSTLKFGFSLLSASLAGACLVLPTIIRTTEEALLAVPDDYRRGSLALGATKWQTLSRIVLPAAMPGIITGIILSVGRVISETAVFYVTLGGSYRLPTSIMDSGRTLALHLYYLAMDTRAFDKAMGTGAVLVVMIFLINLVINLISRKLTAGVRKVR